MLILVAIGVTAASQTYLDHSKTNLAKSVAEELVLVNGALSAYGTKNYVAIQSGLPVAGVADPLNPTAAELTALSFLPNGFMTSGRNLMGSHYVFNIGLVDVSQGSRIGWLPNLTLPATYTPSATSYKNWALVYIIYTDAPSSDFAFLDKVVAQAAKLPAIGKNVGYTSAINFGKITGFSDLASQPTLAASWKNPIGVSGMLVMMTGYGMVAPAYLQQVGDSRDLTLNRITANGTSYLQDVTQGGQLLNIGQIRSQNEVTANSFWMEGRATSDLCGRIGQMTTDVFGNLVNCTGAAAGINWTPTLNGGATEAGGAGTVASSANPFLTGLLAYSNSVAGSGCVPSVITITESKDIILPPGCQTVEVYLRGAGGGGATPYKTAGVSWSATIPAQPGALAGVSPGSSLAVAAFQKSPEKFFHVTIASAITPPGANGADSFITDNAGTIVAFAPGGVMGGHTQGVAAGAAGAPPVSNFTLANMNAWTSAAYIGSSFSGAGGVTGTFGGIGQTPHPGASGSAVTRGNDLWGAGYGGAGGGGAWTTLVLSLPVAGTPNWKINLIAAPPAYSPSMTGLLTGYTVANNTWHMANIFGGLYTLIHYFSFNYFYFSGTTIAASGAMDYCWNNKGIPILNQVKQFGNLLCKGKTPPSSTTAASGGYGAPGSLILVVH